MTRWARWRERWGQEVLWNGDIKNYLHWTNIQMNKYWMSAYVYVWFAMRGQNPISFAYLCIQIYKLLFACLHVISKCTYSGAHMRFRYIIILLKKWRKKEWNWKMDGNCIFIVATGRRPGKTIERPLAIHWRLATAGYSLATMTVEYSILADIKFTRQYI